MAPGDAHKRERRMFGHMKLECARRAFNHDAAVELLDALAAPTDEAYLELVDQVAGAMWEAQTADGGVCFGFATPWRVPLEDQPAGAPRLTVAHTTCTGNTTVGVDEAGDFVLRRHGPDLDPGHWRDCLLAALAEWPLSRGVAQRAVLWGMAQECWWPELGVELAELMPTAWARLTEQDVDELAWLLNRAERELERRRAAWDRRRRQNAQRSWRAQANDANNGVVVPEPEPVGDWPRFWRALDDVAAPALEPVGESLTAAPDLDDPWLEELWAEQDRLEMGRAPRY
jgi:hypothetical protein